jgi:hypothetical protein
VTGVTINVTGFLDVSFQDAFDVRTSSTFDVRGKEQRSLQKYKFVKFASIFSTNCTRVHSRAINYRLRPAPRRKLIVSFTLIASFFIVLSYLNYYPLTDHSTSNNSVGKAGPPRIKPNTMSVMIVDATAKHTASIIFSHVSSVSLLSVHSLGVGGRHLSHCGTRKEGASDGNASNY